MPVPSRLKAIAHKLVGRAYRKEGELLRQWTASLGQRLHEIRADLIFSFANPFWTNLVGCALSRQTNLPFVAHFSDPYSSHPYMTRLPEEEAGIRGEEAEVVRQASKIVFVSKALERLVMKSHGGEEQAKTAVIPHAFSPKDYPARPSSWHEASRFSIAHIGAFYTQRPPSAFLQALSVFQQRYPEQALKLHVAFVGADLGYTDHTGNDLKEELDRHNFIFPVDIIGRVAYTESLAHMRGANLLVAIDKDIAGSPFLPSKIIDYIGSKTPVIAFTPPDSPTAEVVSRCGGNVFGYTQDEHEQFADRLAGLITCEERKDVAEEAITAYSIDSQTLSYKNLFQEVLSHER